MDKFDTSKNFPHLISIYDTYLLLIKDHLKKFFNNKKINNLINCEDLFDI